MNTIVQLPDQLPNPGFYQTWYHLYGAGKALAVVELAQKTGRPLLLICPDNQTVNRFVDEIQFFIQDQSAFIGPVIRLPDRETLPYDRFSPHQDILSERIAALSALPTLKTGIVVAALTTLMMRLPPSGYLSLLAVPLRCGQRCIRDDLRAQLIQCGYRLSESVFEHGDFAVRGAVLDLFPMGLDQPVRIEFFDETIESLRYFDVESQRSGAQIEQIAMLPASECPLDADAIRRFRQQWVRYFDTDPKQCTLYQDVVQGIHSPGLEYYLPLFFESTHSFFQYLPKDSLILAEAELQTPFRQYYAEIQRRYAELGHDVRRPIIAPHAVFIPEEEFFHYFNAVPRIRMQEEPATGMVVDAGLRASPGLTVDARESDSLSALIAHLAQIAHRRILIQCESTGRREALREHLQRLGLRTTTVENWSMFLTQADRLVLTVGQLRWGFATDTFELISEAQLYGTRVMQRRRRRSANGFQEDLVLRSLLDLTIGCPMVHVDHGVGRYHGLVTLELEGQSQEFLLLIYADDARLYVPVAHLHLVARYAGHEVQNAPLHRLGSGQWEKARKQAAEKIHDVAAELLDIHARRALRTGLSSMVDPVEYERFVAGFPFEETADQAAAIESTLQDMASPRPMDRLICGDVGFGKTEVAMRATFVAVHNGLQVAVLVPTTLLAQQHYETFCDRFANWPVLIEVLSRFRSPSQIRQSLDALAAGKIDIVIGTHKLLQSDVQFARLGLMIVDEEHRFGVRHKEKLKSLRAEVDMLTLTATPIPRTLNMALTGLRDLSIIATAPSRRLAIRTFVRAYRTDIIKEAMLREILRGGQVYYLHNEVETIEHCQHQLCALIPEARIAVAHGQMRERELEQVMHQFYHKQYNVLLCTTIIETGIDIPSANTIIIERADRLGMAQLHQLRGRVGRSHHQAYAYLLTPEEGLISADARKRLDALALAQDLGSGFVLASQDLEIRGAGELLGAEQSGCMEAVGYSLYMDMLDRAVNDIKEGRTVDSDPFVHHMGEIQLRIPALIPETYLPDVQLRLQMYRRMAVARNMQELEELKIEMIDRFGMIPDAVGYLFRVQKIRVHARQLRISRIDAHAHGGSLEFSASTTVEPMQLIRLIQQAPKQFKLEGNNRLKVVRDLGQTELRLSCIEEIIEKLLVT